MNMHELGLLCYTGSSFIKKTKFIYLEKYYDVFSYKLYFLNSSLSNDSLFLMTTNIQHFSMTTCKTCPSDNSYTYF